MGRHSRRPAALRAVGWVKLVTTTLVVGVLLLAGVQGSAPTGASSSTASAAAACSTSDPAYDDVVPSAAHTMAMVRTPAGHTRVVSFERGWAVYNGRAPGTFLRVCAADDAPGR